MLPLAFPALWACARLNSPPLRGRSGCCSEIEETPRTPPLSLRRAAVLLLLLLLWTLQTAVNMAAAAFELCESQKARRVEVPGTIQPCTFRFDV